MSCMTKPHGKKCCLGLFHQPDHFATNAIQWDRPFKPKTKSWTKLRNNYVSGIEIQSHKQFFSLGYLGYSMRPKARGLAQHGGPPDWLEESDSASVILYVMDWLYRLPFPFHTGCPDRSCPAASWWNFKLCYIVNVHNHPSWAMSRKVGMAGTLVDPCLLFRDTRGGISAAIACSILNPRGAFLLHE